MDKDMDTRKALTEALECVDGDLRTSRKCGDNDDADMLDQVYAVIKKLRDNPVSLVVEGEVISLSKIQATQLLRGMFYVGSDRKLAVWDAWGEEDLSEWQTIQEKMWEVLGKPDVNLFD